MSEIDTSGFKSAEQHLPELYEQVPGLPYTTRHTAEVIAEVVGDPRRNDTLGSSAPRSVAVACLYLADYIVRGEDRLRQTDIAERVGGSHVTIRRHYPLIPETFVDTATDDEIEQLGPAIYETIKEFALIEREGPGINSVDTEAIRESAGVAGIDPEQYARQQTPTENT